jgi:membrane protease YdiL (CAAX protease family)
MIDDQTDPSGAAAAAARSHELPGNHPAPDGESASAPIRTEPSPLPRPGVVVPEDLRVPWGGIDLLLFAVFGFVGLLVVGMIVAGITMVGFGVSMRDLGPASTSPAKSAILVLSQAAWSGLVMVYFFSLVRMRTQSPFWRTMGWRELRLGALPPAASAVRCLGGGALLAVFVSAAGRFFGQQNELPIEQMFRSRPAVLLLMGFGILVAPLVEETMFRGFLYPVIARRFGMAAGVFITGALFGAMHAQQLWGGWGQIVLLILVGILLTWVRARTGTVTASYLVHLGYNTLLFLGFFAATGGLRHIPGG